MFLKFNSRNILVDKVFHISHNDLDGYGASYIFSKVSGYKNLKQYNVDYPDFEKTLQEVIDVANSLSSAHIVISDIGFSEKVASMLKSLDSNKTKVSYFDHHVISSESVSLVEELISMGHTIVLDYSKCATKIVYDYYDGKDNHAFVDCLDVYDRWIRLRQTVIDAMSFFSDCVYNSPLIFPESKRNFLFKLFSAKEAAGTFDSIISKSLAIDTGRGSLRDLDAMQRLMLDNEQKYITFCSKHALNIKRPLPILQSMYLSELPEFERLLHENAHYTASGAKVALVVNIPSKNFQYLSAEYLNQKPQEFDVIVRLNTNNGNMSFRSAKERARDLAIKFGGGGHLNAGGANANNITDGDLVQATINMIKYF
jgi:oligoribonuclease NrnB/cAMP/cGMP phosphodiesterase (DHH superfamily)